MGSYPNVSFALDSAMGLIKELTGEDLNQLTGLDTYNFNMGGWLTPGFTFNPSNPSDRSNGPVQFNNRANELQLYQLGLFVEKPLRREIVSGGGNPRKDGCKNPLFYNWGSAPNPALAVRQGCWNDIHSSTPANSV
ncbi:MAG: hypothetical protein NTV66_09535, partial [Methylococcales bacterium]|nr:hypothetical protein [Methylococcales bacterium]